MIVFKGISMRSGFKRLAVFSLLSVALVGCQVSPDVSQLNNKNQQLAQQLSASQAEVARLTQREQLLSGDVAELGRVVNVLGVEKTSRVEESSELRGQVRKFVLQQIDSLKGFLVDGNLLDYVGGELVSRTKQESAPLTLIDFAHPMPNAGTLTGVGAYFTAAAELQVKVLRPVGDHYVLIWQSQPLSVESAGLARLSFPVSVGVEKGDVMAYQFSRATSVSFDSGTGRTLYSNQALGLGSQVRASSLSGERDRRAYSIGVYGLLN